MKQKTTYGLMIGIGCVLTTIVSAYQIIGQTQNAQAPQAQPAQPTHAQQVKPEQLPSALSPQTTAEPTVSTTTAPVPVGVAVSPSSEQLSQVDTAESITKGLNDFAPPVFLGFTAKNEALYLLNDVETGKFFWFDPATGKKTRELASSRLSFDTCRLSQDGKYVFATDNVNNLPDGNLYLNDLLILDSQNTKLLKRMKTNKPKVGIFNPCPVNSDVSKISFPVLESTWNAELKDFAGDPERGARIEVWNWKTGRREKALRYSHAPGVADMAFSPDSKYIACLFKSESGAYDPHGILDIVDGSTGKILWHIRGDKKRPAGYPFTFLSSTQFVCQNVIYNVQAKKFRPLFGSDDRRLKFVGGVPGHRGHLLIMTKDGLELWEWPAQRALHRWPDITEADEIKFAPDLKAMAVQIASKSLTQFWKFDPKWLT